MKKTVIITIFVIPFAFGLFESSLKKIKNKAKNIYKSKFGKDKTWHYLGYDLSEYPGTNEKFRQKNREKWNEYYECLKTQEKHLGEELSITPEALLAFETNSIQLECKICKSPLERDTNSVQWYWASKTSTKLIQIQTTEHIFISPEDQTLHLYNLEIESTGQYLCHMGNSLIAPYFLTVIPFKEDDMITVHSNQATNGPYAQQIEFISELGITLNTEWSPWSPCSKCNQVGKRHRLGYCTIYLTDKNVS